MAQAAYGDSGASMNHFIAGYLVPLVRARSKIHDVTLHVLTENQDV